MVHFGRHIVDPNERLALLDDAIKVTKCSISITITLSRACCFFQICYQLVATSPFFLSLSVNANYSASKDLT